MTATDSASVGSAEDRATLPIPGWSLLTEPYWLAAGQGNLAIQKCTACSTLTFPPTAACYNCQATDLAWTPVSGTGKVFSFTWADFPPTPDGSDRNISVIELDDEAGPDPVRVLSWVQNVSRDDLHIGMPVKVVFLPFDGQVAVPAWEPATPAS